MSKKNNQNKANQNQQNIAGNGKKDEGKKPELITKIKSAGDKHPKLTKVASITTKVVVTGLAAVGGAGLVMAVNDRKINKAASVPTLPDIPAMPVTPVSTDDQAE